MIIRVKATGEPVLETSDPCKVAVLNLSKFEAVPTLQHLAELNDMGSKARQWASQSH